MKKSCSSPASYFNDSAVCLPLLYTYRIMTPGDLIKQTVGTYQKHGWQLRRVLLRPETIGALNVEPGYDSLQLSPTQIKESTIDALWFSRPSHEQREAWELRLLAENPFALFETFEEDETEEQREEMRWEMEARMRDHLEKGS